ncbi:hypothetical protein UPYG_G00352030 [Umbra pygmaea]|uniref:Cystatin domain-containing protein n=1 Tax=Umbra pygmaea TaxID=75934 RepID=A0ABD0W2W9_UMBPY
MFNQKTQSSRGHPTLTRKLSYSAQHKLLLHRLSGQEQSQPVDTELITTRNVQPLGGWFKRDTKSVEIQAAAQAAVKKFNSKSKSKKYFRLVDIIAAETQVTNTINHRIEVVIGKTNCLKSEENADVDSCVLGKKRLTCIFDVQLNPRNNQLDISTSSCQKVQ